MKRVRLYIQRQIFTKQKAENIKNEIEMIMQNANKQIQEINGIDKYQELYGSQELTIDVTSNGSILDRFRYKNWNRLDHTIPKWSYPFIYDVAVEESKRHCHTPEGMCASSFAAETVKQLDKIMIKESHQKS